MHGAVAHPVPMRRPLNVDKERAPGQHRPSFIREWRVHRDMTQDELANRVGVDRSHLSKLERGIVGYTQPLLEAIAVALNCEPADLLSRNPGNGAAIWQLWDRAKPAERRQIEAIAETILRTGTEP